MRGGFAEGLFIKRMRDIKFRGRTQAGRWVYGYYNQTYTYEQGYRDCVFNHNVGFVDVLPETVGQFTGLHDKNGKDIYEGDIVRYDMGGECEVSYCVSGGYAGFAYRQFHNKEHHLTDVEVIGNIHDNPELL